jgi:hypothetical protein
MLLFNATDTECSVQPIAKVAFIALSIATPCLCRQSAILALTMLNPRFSINRKTIASKHMSAPIEY